MSGFYFIGDKRSVSGKNLMYGTELHVCVLVWRKQIELHYSIAKVLFLITLDITTQFQYVATLYFAPAEIAKYLD